MAVELETSVVSVQISLPLTASTLAFRSPSAVFAGTLTYRDEARINGANQVNVTKSGSDVIVHVNLDADLADEMRIVLDNTSLSSMSKGDFIL